MKKGIWIWGTAALLVAGAVAARADAAGGKTIFESKCAACHGKDGSKKFTDVQTKSAEDLIKIVKEGVKGKPMPAWGSKLSDDEIKDVVAYVQSLKK